MAFHETYKGLATSPLNIPMRDDEARELEKNLESGEYSPIKLVKSDAFESFLEKERADISVISDPSVDKEGDVVDPDTISFAKYQKNPVVTFNHRYDLPPVAKSLWQKKCNGRVWKAKTQYISRPDNHPSEAIWMPDSIYHMVKSGSMQGKSLGGAVKWRDPTEEDAKRLNFDLAKARRISEAVDVFEYACCPIGVNGNAVVEAVAKSLYKVHSDLISDIPELVEWIQKSKQAEDDKIEIKSYQTAEQFLSSRNAALRKALKDFEVNAPLMVDQILKRAMGRVS